MTLTRSVCRLVVLLAVATAGVGGLAAFGGDSVEGRPVDPAGDRDRPTTERAQNATSETGSDTPPVVVAVYPNPTADGDRGEWVRLRLPPGNWTLTDGETTVTVAGPGHVTVTPDPAAVNASRVRAADLSLANGGERLVVRPAANGSTGENDTTVDANGTGENDTTVDANGTGADASGERTTSVVYRDAPDGEVWYPAAGEWRPAGYEPRAVTALGQAEGTAFVLPDSPNVPIEPLRQADRRIVLAAYTFGSRRVTDALLAAADRGVTVRVLVEGGPVGGVSRREARLLSELTAGGVAVRVVAGPAPRVRYHHAKYAVADDTALVTTENWKPSGTGGASNRGWGLRLADARVARELAGLFRTDWEARDAVPWAQFRRGRTFEPATAANASYPTAFDPVAFRANATFLLTAPGNAGRGIRSVIDTADHRIDVVQPTVTDEGLLRATKRAARRGVRVRILLSGAWYTAEENRRRVAALNAWADRTGAPLAARLVDPGGAFDVLHAKGLVVDGTVVVGSVNWTPTSQRENREVAVAVRSDRLADYYRRVAASDWADPSDRSLSPTLGVIGCGVAALAVLLVARRVSFAELER